MSNVDDTHRPAAALAPLAPPQRLLLGPGPANLHPEVLAVMSRPLVGHLDPYFTQLMDETQGLLKYAVQAGEGAVCFPVSGTGSAAMEMAFVNTLERGDRILVANAGYFADRATDMCGRVGAEVVTVKKPWGECFSLAELEAAMEEHKPSALFLVHADTSTGVRQPLEGVGALCDRFGATLIMDAVTSLAAEPLFMRDLGRSVVIYSGGQKCVGAPPGSSPIAFSAGAMERVRARKSQVPNWYLDVNLITRYWTSTDNAAAPKAGAGARAYHHTAPITSCYSIREALRVIATEGLEPRWARHRRNAELLWAKLAELGLELFVPAEHRLVALTAVRVPDGVDAKAVSRYLMESHSIEIGGGLGGLPVWRIGLMAHNSSEENVNRLVAALKEALDAQKK